MHLWNNRFSGPLIDFDLSILSDMYLGGNNLDGPIIEFTKVLSLNYINLGIFMCLGLGFKFMCQKGCDIFLT